MVVITASRVYPSNLLEVCQPVGFKKKAHLLCQTEFKHEQNINSSGMAANGGENGTSTTAGGKQRPIANKINTNNTFDTDKYCR
eukprot:1020950-Ditylum_brightwellii.AAC.2